MANANPSRLGQINAAGDVLATFLKVFSGETLNAFDRTAFFKGTTLERTIPSGKSAQFPAIGITSAYTHVPGDEILGQKINSGERVINIEGKLVAPVFISDVDELMNHFDIRGIYSNDIGQALSKQYDQDKSRVLVAGARQTAAIVNGVYAGDAFTRAAINAAYATDGSVLFNGITDRLVVMDERDIPMQDRNIVVRPVQYSLLVKSEKPFDFRLNDGQTGLGGYADGVVRRIYGVPVNKTNNYYQTDDTANTAQPTARRLDYSGSKALIYHRSGAGTVALQDITMEAQYDMRRQGYLMLGKYMFGHDWLCPEAIEELRAA